MYDALLLTVAVEMHAEANGDESDVVSFEELEDEERERWFNQARTALRVFMEDYRQERLAETRFLMNLDDSVVAAARANAALDGIDFDKLPKKAKAAALDRARKIVAAIKAPANLFPGQLLGFSTVYEDEDGAPRLGGVEIETSKDVTFYAEEFSQKLGVAAVYLLVEGPTVDDSIN